VNYQVLTQKWRPKVFQEIVGQEHVTRTLINAISLGRIAHAYLFAGPHGTGKTSTARILAKALNCEKGPTPLPCNKCSNCIEISRGESLDVLEIDGASNRGIDEIRELRERIGFSPIKARYKIYIIDEVHMLTHPAFNALLKTLEEPPHYVIFIFATTDPDKLPLTIISRCQRFDFRRIGTSDILRRLTQIVKEEKIDVTPQALELIARASGNSMRDAEKILDQLTSYTLEKINEKDVSQALGMVEDEFLARLTENLYHRDVLSNIKIIHQLIEKGKNPRWIVKGWLNWLRDLAMIKIGGEKLPSLSSHSELIKTQVSYFTLEELISFMEHLSDVEEKMHFSSTPQIHLEILMIKLCSYEKELEQLRKKDPYLAIIYKKVVDLEEKISRKVSSIEKSEGKEKIIKEKPEVGEKPRVRASPISSKEDKRLAEVKEGAVDRKDLLDKWYSVVKQVKKKKKTLGTFLEKMQVLSVEEKSIVLGSKLNFFKETLEKRENKRIISEELKKTFPLDFSIQFQQINLEKKKEEISSSLREAVAQAIEIFEGEIVNGNTAGR